MSASFGPSAVRVTPKQFTRVVPRPTSLCHQFERAAPRLWCWCDCHPERSEGSAIGSTADSSSPSAPQNDSAGEPDRKSTRLNSSHLVISYAVFCLKKKKNKDKIF